MTNPVVHIAGLPVRIGGQLRQLCAWCSAVLIDEDLSRSVGLPGQEGGPPAWPAGELVRCQGNLTVVVEHMDGADVPGDCCARAEAGNVPQAGAAQQTEGGR